MYRKGTVEVGGVAAVPYFKVKGHWQMWNLLVTGVAVQVKMNLKIMFFLHLNICPFPSYFLQSHSSSHSSEVDEN